ncbi:hypothetical protein PUN28_006994 [Cardiocondyla obscurior]|uniref:Uncharacterized protein n=1 Tax=Cardiocondyla obscurior TaxID=286306 RepID=A0AAW2G363_9HYME
MCRGLHSGGGRVTRGGEQRVRIVGEIDRQDAADVKEGRNFVSERQGPPMWWVHSHVVNNVVVAVSATCTYPSESSSPRPTHEDELELVEEPDSPRARAHSRHAAREPQPRACESLEGHPRNANPPSATGGFPSGLARARARWERGSPPRAFLPASSAKIATERHASALPTRSRCARKTFAATFRQVMQNFKDELYLYYNFIE